MERNKMRITQKSSMALMFLKSISEAILNLIVRGSGLKSRLKRSCLRHQGNGNVKESMSFDGGHAIMLIWSNISSFRHSLSTAIFLLFSIQVTIDYLCKVLPCASYRLSKIWQRSAWFNMQMSPGVDRMSWSCQESSHVVLRKNSIWQPLLNNLSKQTYLGQVWHSLYGCF